MTYKNRPEMTYNVSSGTLSLYTTTSLYVSWQNIYCKVMYTLVPADSV